MSRPDSFLDADEVAARTSLSEAQAQVWVRANSGRTPKEIAEELDKDQSTISAHLSRIRSKARQARETTAIVTDLGLLNPAKSDLYSNDYVGQDWSAWEPLTSNDISAPTLPGIYRIRHPEFEGYIYVGETQDLRRRLYQLARGISNESRPYRDPHTAAPCCHDIAEKFGDEFEVSYARPVGVADPTTRKGIEAAVVAAHRRDCNSSPVAQFGNVLPGYKLPNYRGQGNGNDADEYETDDHYESASPLQWFRFQQVTDSEWMGLDWGFSRPLENRLNFESPDRALYRIGLPDEKGLAYIGQTTALTDRLRAHEERFGGDARVSVVDITDHLTEKEKEKNQLHELETDLIGAHMFAVGSPPQSQFVGGNYDN